MGEDKRAKGPSATQDATGGLAYMNGEIIPLEEAQVNIATHALNYGTGCFEGIRAYWNSEEDELYVLKMKEHYERMVNSCRILKIDPGLSAGEMGRITLELLRANSYRQDVYIRPLAFKSGRRIKLGLTGIDDAFGIFCVPMGDYLDTGRGLRMCVSSWVRLDDNALPARAKVTGAYINACLATDEAVSNGYDEAIMLTPDGHVSEAASANLFMVRRGRLITTPVTDAILEGVTRDAVLEIATVELDLMPEIRSIDRTELYVADELFICGTGVQVGAVVEVDGRVIADGKPGPLTKTLQATYFDAVRGRNPRFLSWLSPVYRPAG